MHDRAPATPLPHCMEAVAQVRGSASRPIAGLTRGVLRAREKAPRQISRGETPVTAAPPIYATASMEATAAAATSRPPLFAQRSSGVIGAAELPVSRRAAKRQAAGLAVRDDAPDGADVGSR